MRILLIRHGESVDNVAGLLAGSRDSPLTNHGVLQIKRLGAHIAKRCETIGPIKHIFTSNLQRAYQTAEAIAKAIAEVQDSPSHNESPLEVIRLPELREKDYGSFEGKKYRVKTGNSSDTSPQSDSETNGSMKLRANQFLDHLIHVVDGHVSDHITVVIVAHGIILGVLLAALLERFPPRSSSSSTQAGDRGGPPELVAWGNTGVLQARLEPTSDEPLVDSQVSGDNTGSLAKRRQMALCLTVEFVNNLEHLEGLKKTRGGIGSAKFDSRQRTVDSFFTPASKKRKLEEEKD
ncbi:phosphoglycerate mutase-like protein [Hypoxylon cercidicola]|nr:phosphoglycerate mutase-like protein [Hypoxylon cercidicola]